MLAREAERSDLAPPIVPFPPPMPVMPSSPPVGLGMPPPPGMVPRSMSPPRAVTNENGELKKLLSFKTSANEELESRCYRAESALAQLQAHYETLAKESHALKEGLVHEQFHNEKAHMEVEQLKREVDDQNAELRELRTSWTEREKRIEQLETQRIFYEEELSSIGHQYQTLLDKLSFVITDYSVRTAPIQVRVGGGYELLSTYLNRIFEDQAKLKDQYDRTIPHSPAIMNKYSPEKAVNKLTADNRSPMVKSQAAPVSPNKSSPSKATETREPVAAPWYEPLRTQQIAWAQGLRSPSPTRKSPTKARR